MQLESTRMAWVPDAGRSGEGESAVLTLLQLPEVDSGTESDISGHLAESNRRLAGQRKPSAGEIRSSRVDARNSGDLASLHAPPKIELPTDTEPKVSVR